MVDTLIVRIYHSIVRRKAYMYINILYNNILLDRLIGDNIKSSGFHKRLQPNNIYNYYFYNFIYNYTDSYLIFFTSPACA